MAKLCKCSFLGHHKGIFTPKICEKILPLLSKKTCFACSVVLMQSQAELKVRFLTKGLIYATRQGEKQKENLLGENGPTDLKNGS